MGSPFDVTLEWGHKSVARLLRPLTADLTETDTTSGENDGEEGSEDDDMESDEPNKKQAPQPLDRGLNQLARVPLVLI